MIRPIHSLVQIGARFRQLADHLGVAERDRREQCVVRPIRQQVARDFHVMGVIPTDRPTEHVQFMRRAGPNRICAVLDEPCDDGKIAALGGEMNGKGVVAFVTNVRVGAAFEQHPHDRFVLHAEVQRGP